MDSGSPETWRWIWLITMVTFGLGEIAVAGSFFLAPFAIGAGVAAILAFSGVGLAGEWIAFLGVSVAAFAGLRPVVRKLDSEGPTLGVGAHRQLGQRAKVLDPIIGEHSPGVVLLDGEHWRAESETGRSIAAGTTVVVTKVRGTRLVVAPADPETMPASPPTVPPTLPPTQGDTL